MAEFRPATPDQAELLDSLVEQGLLMPSGVPGDPLGTRIVTTKSHETPPPKPSQTTQLRFPELEGEFPE